MKTGEFSSSPFRDKKRSLHRGLHGAASRLRGQCGRPTETDKKEGREEDEAVKRKGREEGRRRLLLGLFLLSPRRRAGSLFQTGPWQ